MTIHNKVAVIFAGGSGKRLWPLSTQKVPKQINHDLSKQSMLVEAYNRAQRIFEKKNIVVVTTKQLLPATKKLLPLEDKNIVVQPKNADTSIAMCLTAMYLDTIFPDCIAVYMYSDHYVKEDDKFDDAMHEALSLTHDKDRMIVVGTQPSYANIGFGYIKMGKRIRYDVCKVEDFKEKPSRMAAAQMVASKKWLWNTGIKVWKISKLLKAIKSADPKMYKILLDLRVELNSENYWDKLEYYYRSIDPVSFESSIASKLPELYVLEADYHWEDIGDWRTIYDMSEKDECGNAIKLPTQEKDVRLLDAKNCLIMSTSKKKIVLIDVEDLMVVQTKYALLICKKQMTPRVKEVADG